MLRLYHLKGDGVLFKLADGRFDGKFDAGSFTGMYCIIYTAIAKTTIIAITEIISFSVSFIIFVTIQSPWTYRSMQLMPILLLWLLFFVLRASQQLPLGPSVHFHP